jgi:antitoxin CptB
MNYLQQLRWRSRRGLLELELLLLPFATHRLELLDPHSLRDYERLLACEDLDIFDWLQQRATPEDNSLVKIAAEIRDYQRSLKSAS